MMKVSKKFESKNQNMLKSNTLTSVSKKCSKTTGFLLVLNNYLKQTISIYAKH